MKYSVETDSQNVRVCFTKTDIDEDRTKKQIHDIRASLRTLNLCVESIQAGYHFDDHLAEAKLAALARAVNLLGHEAKILEELYLVLIDESEQV